VLSEYHSNQTIEHAVHAHRMPFTALAGMSPFGAIYRDTASSGDAFKGVSTAAFKLKDYTLIASIVSATKAKTDGPHYSMSFDFVKGIISVPSLISYSYS
jgi:hypothetical protein